jgi:hypothetical protein
MDKKSKILLWLLALLIIASVGVTYWRIMIKKDYIIESQIDCDPAEKACFVWECDPASTVEGEACTDNPDDNIWYYSLAKRKAANIPLCDASTDENCDPWTCADGEKDCSETLCDDTNKTEQGVECNNVEQYNIDNPAEEESTCEEGDEECLAANESACAEDDEECLAAEEESACDEGDEECLAAEEENAAADSTEEDVATDDADTATNQQ